MVMHVRLEQTGNSQVMQLANTDPQAPGPGEVWLEQAAIGVNPLDVNQRKGDVPIALPS